MPAPTATDSLEPLNFRHRKSKRLVLESFKTEDGHSELTPVLREAVDFYAAYRQRYGRKAIREILQVDSAA